MKTMIFMQIAVASDAAETVSRTFSSGNSSNDLLMIALVVVMVVILVAAAVVLKAMQTMIKMTMPQLLEDEKAAVSAARADRRTRRITRWNKLMGLRPIAEEEELVIDHAYDDIKELDNPVPAWFNALFYGSMAFAVIYLCVYHVFGWGLNQDQEYEREMALAEVARQEWLAQSANNVDENNVELNGSPEVLASGQAIFTQNCAACHGGSGEGGIGPNLTDEYWLHGGDIKSIFKVVKYGVLDKGMVPWEQNLTPGQIAEVSNYILSLQGTNPPNAKAPQGQLEEVETTPAGGEETAI
ncbi:cbb3-type cytochrome c oxidase N-terminal domain-containing protein [Parapedobacter lycopersici]|uniref:cbb3-type cytochrome c oxidase N-terminal domain-containing protein n=1 Tax=Parapedobacter lycopersici TaxID=1864939 RepID=UPI003342B6CE